MFFRGTLQEGISAALQRSRQVVCFVTDDGEESQQWETEFLADEAVKGPLQSQAVVLRLLAGSEEAGYLEALFPVPRKPTVVVIQNGQLKEYIAAGTTKEEFLRRLGLVLGGPTAQASASTPTTTTAQSSQTSVPAQPAQATTLNATVQDADDDLYGDGSPSSSSAQNSTPAPAPATAPTASTSSSQDSQPSENIQNLLAERAARLEVDKKAKEAAAKEVAKRRAEERRAANESNEGQHANINSAENKYASLLRKKKRDEKAERERILRRIEDDKRERREREAQERQARLLLAATLDEDSPASSSVQQQESIPLPSRGGGAHCSLQVRLLDGSRIRNRFPSDVKLGKEVREWIDEQRTDGDEPYTFRVVLTPLPNKAIEPAEEADSLLDLGLAPSSTLVLVPRVRVATAFEQTGGALYRAWSGIWALLAMILSLPLTLVGGGRPQVAGGGEEIPLESLNGEDQRVRGFQNPDDRRRDQQLYNGNSLNFEPRGDEDEQEN